MNRATLANLTGIAERAIRAGLVFEPNEMIVAGQAMGQAREMLNSMKDHDVLNISEPEEQKGKTVKMPNTDSKTN